MRREGTEGGDGGRGTEGGDGGRGRRSVKERGVDELTGGMRREGWTIV